LQFLRNRKSQLRRRRRLLHLARRSQDQALRKITTQREQLLSARMACTHMRRIAWEPALVMEALRAGCSRGRLKKASVLPGPFLERHYAADDYCRASITVGSWCT